MPIVQSKYIKNLHVYFSNRTQYQKQYQSSLILGIFEVKSHDALVIVNNWLTIRRALMIKCQCVRESTLLNKLAVEDDVTAKIPVNGSQLSKMKKNIPHMPLP